MTQASPSDAIGGGAGDDILSRGAGLNKLSGNGGHDTLNGSPVSDLLIVNSPGDWMAENRRGAAPTRSAPQSISAWDVPMSRTSVVGRAKLGAGNKLRNRITGNDRDNILDGGGNADTLVGGDGNDTSCCTNPVTG